MSVPMTVPPTSDAQLPATPAPRKRRRRAPTAGAAEDCFTCRKQGRKCDRRRPYCTQCLDEGRACSGYRTTLTWGVGVASRGKLRGMTLPIPKSQQVSAPTSNPTASTTTTTTTPAIRQRARAQSDSAQRASTLEERRKRLRLSPLKTAQDGPVYNWWQSSPGSVTDSPIEESLAFSPWAMGIPRSSPFDALSNSHPGQQSYMAFAGGPTSAPGLTSQAFSSSPVGTPLSTASGFSFDGHSPAPSSIDSFADRVFDMKLNFPPTPDSGLDAFTFSNAPNTPDPSMYGISHHVSPTTSTPAAWPAEFSPQTALHDDIFRLSPQHDHIAKFPSPQSTEMVHSISQQPTSVPATVAPPSHTIANDLVGSWDMAQQTGTISPADISVSAQPQPPPAAPLASAPASAPATVSTSSASGMINPYFTTAPTLAHAQVQQAQAHAQPVFNYANPFNLPQSTMHMLDYYNQAIFATS